MKIGINMVYFWLVISRISVTKCHYNLYDTDQNQNYFFFYDCLRYTVRNTIMEVELIPNFQPPSQIISYCVRPVGNEFDNDELVEDNFSSFRFVDLNRMNVTAQDLIRWSISFDLIENYQEYLDTGKSTLAEQVLKNCSHGWFGLDCQYAVHADADFSATLRIIFSYKQRREDNKLFLLESTNLICYVLLICNRCLDWREICDGKTDCSDDSDEQNCFDLEMNECAEDEYRCQNGMCVPEVFLNDYPSNPDCLDSTDEQEKKSLNLRFYGYPDCFKDPAFRCEESQHSFRLRNFPCGDGETSFIFQLQCRNRRDVIHFQTLFSYEKNSILPFDCWIALYCATGIGNIANEQCNTFCRALRCTYDLQDKCTSVLVLFPQQAILHNHIRFAYWTNKTIEKRIFQTSLLPDYVCYDAQRCPFLIPTLHMNGSACILTTTLQVNTTREIDLLFRTCLVKHENINLTDVRIESLFRCPGTTKLISKHRLLDGILDCYGGADETNKESCTLNQKHRFQCQSENKCISPVTMYDSVSNCVKGEDEKRTEKTLISFQKFCNGFIDVVPELLENQNETDETNCETWPCDNMYTHCDRA